MYQYGDAIHSLEDDEWWVNRNRETRGAVPNELLDMSRAAQVESRSVKAELKRVAADKYAGRISEADAEAEYASLNEQIDDIAEFSRLVDRMRGVVKLAASQRQGRSNRQLIWIHQMKTLNSGDKPTKYDLELWSKAGLDLQVAFDTLRSQGSDV